MCKCFENSPSPPPSVGCSGSTRLSQGLLRALARILTVAEAGKHFL